MSRELREGMTFLTILGINLNLSSRETESVEATV